MFDSRGEHNGSVAGYDGGAVEAKRGALDDGDEAATRCVADNKKILQYHDRHPDEQSRTGEWKTEALCVFAYHCAQLGGSRPRSETDVGFALGNEAFTVKEIAVQFYSISLRCTEDAAVRMYQSVQDGSGLGAVRLLMTRYEPRMPGTKRALLKAVVSDAPAKKLEEIEKNLMNVDELMKKCEVLGGEPLPEDLRVIVIIDLCAIDLEDHFELITREVQHKEVPD